MPKKGTNYGRLTVVLVEMGLVDHDGTLPMRYDSLLCIPLTGRGQRRAVASDSVLGLWTGSRSSTGLPLNSESVVSIG